LLGVLERELAIHQIRLLSRNACECDGSQMSINACVKKHKDASRNNIKIILKLWNELKDILKEENGGGTCSELREMFIPAIKNLYASSLKFSKLKELGISDCLKNAVDRDSDSFSGLTMGKVIDFKLSIDWMDHLIRRDIYICALLKRFREAARSKPVVVARGVMGPWSNVDLPILERVFEWDDIEEETSGRGGDKRNQRRYRMGLENYGEGDTTSNEGFYWREIRNEPYSFDDEDETLYPHRNQLWR